MNDDARYQSLSPEMKLLLHCSRSALSPEQLQAVKDLLHSPIDWKLFLALTLKNRVYPVVFMNLNKLETGSVDASVLRKLEAKCKKNQLKALQLGTELIKVIGLLEKQNIEAISFKGPYLGVSLYHDLSMRVSKDLDIFVPPTELERIDPILKEAGYSCEAGGLPLSRKQRQAHLQNSHHLTYTNQARVHLELHWRLSEVYYNLSFEQAWKNTEEADLFGRKLHVFRQEENLVYLIYHGSRHGWKRLRWLCDIYEILSSKKLDWEYVLTRSKELGVLFQLKQAEILLKVLFQFEFPIQYEISKAECSYAMRLADMALPLITTTDNTPEAAGHSLFQFHTNYSFAWRKGFGNKLRHFFGIMGPHVTDFEACKLDDKYFFLYYLYRPFRLLKKYVKLGIEARTKSELKNN